jgi:hypothetical protein
LQIGGQPPAKSEGDLHLNKCTGLGGVLLYNSSYEGAGDWDDFKEKPDRQKSH